MNIETLAKAIDISELELEEIIANAGITKVTATIMSSDLVKGKKELAEYVSLLALRNAKQTKDNSEIIIAAKRVWKCDAVLRSEFNDDFDIFLAYEQGIAGKGF